jgi:hypothetical protein
MEGQRLPVFTALHQEENERPSCKWKINIKSITEDTASEDGDRENRLTAETEHETPTKGHIWRLKNVKRCAHKM